MKFYNKLIVIYTLEINNAINVYNTSFKICFMKEKIILTGTS